MKASQFEQLLLESAEQTDRKLTSRRISLLKDSYSFFKEAGLEDDDIKNIMALTSYELQKIR